MMRNDVAALWRLSHRATFGATFIVNDVIKTVGFKTLGVTSSQGRRCFPRLHAGEPSCNDDYSIGAENVMNISSVHVQYMSHGALAKRRGSLRYDTPLFSDVGKRPATRAAQEPTNETVRQPNQRNAATDSVITGSDIDEQAGGGFSIL
jgi:hypothetical protein